ncbi:MAG TPA: CmcJ/NvfI family oxidoreductase [Alphaproteobacteria bacterium]|jgi:hypothetical protein
MSESASVSSARPGAAQPAAYSANDSAVLRALDDVRASINYLVPTGERPRAYQYDPPPGVPLRTGTYAGYPVLVRNGRASQGKLSLDREGFELVRTPTRFTAFRDPEAVKAAYYREVEAAVKRATGAARVIVFDHNVRHAPSALEKKNGAKEPVKRAHNDYTVKSGPQRVRDLLGAEAEALLARRFAIINLWRPITGPVEESPLALCDAQSIAPADLVPTDLIYRDRIGETYALAHNSAHRWYYFPRLGTDEAVLIKCYDSASDGRARFAAHGAFDDPTSPANARPRESIEARTIAFF